MESNFGQKRKSSSVICELSDEMIENQLHNDSLTHGDTSRRQLQMLHDNIESAEAEHDSMKSKWDAFKSFHYSSNIYNASKTDLIEKSDLSFNNHKILLSQQSSQREDTENTDYYNEKEEENTMNCVSTVNNIQIVLTPRSQINDSQTHCSQEIPNLRIEIEESLENVNSNKHTKKSLKSKKKFRCPSIIDGPIKVSSLTTGKKKRRKFHGRLKTSNSKSTVTTRETIFSEKKNDRRKFKKQKSLDTISVLQPPHFRKRANNLKPRETNNSINTRSINSKDFVELYHNHNALKTESFVVSKLPKTKPTEAPLVEEEIMEEVSDCESKKDVSVAEKSMETLLPTEVEEKVEKMEKIGKSSDKNECEMKTDRCYEPGLYDNFCQRNYELPTFSSKMKQVERQYYHRFNIRSIPFIVGTSISPSHNLGLNIQQVLSLIKTKQPAIPGISPIAIRNVSQGITPVSSLFEHITNGFARSCRTNSLSNQDSSRLQKNTSRINQGISNVSFESLRTNNLSTQISSSIPSKQPFVCEPLYEEDEETHSVYSNSRNSIDQRKSLMDNRLESSLSKYQQQPHVFEKQPRSNGQHYAKSSFGDGNGNYIYNQRNDKETARVFTRLYDQFNKMIMQQEKLKEQYDQSKDKALLKEIAEMEESLTSKQQEIVTVVNLYNEVLALKKQMKQLHERNSSVCIGREESALDNISRSAKLQRRAQTVSSFDWKSQSKCFPNRSSLVMQEAPQALRLTGLLRQIQAFQRQLIMA